MNEALYIFVKNDGKLVLFEYDDLNTKIKKDNNKIGKLQRNSILFK